MISRHFFFFTCHYKDLLGALWETLPDDSDGPDDFTNDFIVCVYSLCSALTSGHAEEISVPAAGVSSDGQQQKLEISL